MKIVLLFLIGCLVVSCGELDEKVEVPSEQVGDTLQNDYAEAFRMIRYPDFMQIEIILPDTKEVLFQYGVGNRVPQHLTKVSPELKRVIALSSTHLGMISALGRQEFVVGVSDAKYLCDMEYVKRWNEKSLRSLGDIGMTDFEGYVAVNPDLVMHSGFDLNSPGLKKMQDLGLDLFVNFDWRETTPLGRLEWIKVMGVLFHAEEEALNIYQQSKSAYIQLAEQMATVAKKPTVIMGTMYGDVFNAPAGESYKVKLIQDAGGDYVYGSTKGTGSLSLSLEELIMQNRDTEIWLDVASSSSEEVLQMSQNFNMLESFRNNRMYSYMNNINCYWEETIVKPHVLLEDFVKIFHPTSDSDSLVFYLKLPAHLSH